MYKDIIIRVDGKEESRKVQEKLFAAGNIWCSGDSDYLFVPYDPAYIDVDADGRMAYGSEVYFEDHYNLSDYTPFKDFMATCFNKQPPLGLKPKEIVDKERTKEILEAMLRYVEADVKVPNAWWQELGDILVTE